MNKVNETEVKTIVYGEVKQYFTEETNLSNDIKTDYFRIKQREEKVIHSGNATIVILDDGSKGVAKCMEGDEYNKTTGIKIAYIRAKMKSLQKELNQLTKQ